MNSIEIVLTNCREDLSTLAKSSDNLDEMFMLSISYFKGLAEGMASSKNETLLNALNGVDTGDLKELVHWIYLNTIGH